VTMNAEQLVNAALVVTQEAVHPTKVNEDFWRPTLMALAEGARQHIDADDMTTQLWLDSPVETPTTSLSLLTVAQMFGLLEEWDEGALWSWASAAN